MLLTFNIGNREISIGFITDGNLMGTASISGDPGRTADEYACILKSLLDFRGLLPSSFDGAIGSSVDPAVTDTFVRAVTFMLGIRVHMLTSGTKTGLNILTEDPTQLGGDLVASAVGALAKYKPPMILVDFGIATTFSVINRDGGFAGCSIAPGVILSSEALSSSAGLLPHIAHDVPKKCIGTNTAESMRSGSVFGNASMVDGMIDRIQSELGYEATVIAMTLCFLPDLKRYTKRTTENRARRNPIYDLRFESCMQSQCIQLSVFCSGDAV